MNIITLIVCSLLASAFFSGIEIAFVSSNKIRLEIDKKRTFIGSILKRFYQNHEQFISTMLVGNNVALVIYGIGMAELLEPFIMLFIPNEAVVVLVQTIVSTIIILVTAEFLPKTIFRINPNLFMRIFAMPLLVIYYLLYPVSKLASILSKGLLRIVGVKPTYREDGQLVSKIDLDFFIQQSLDNTEDVTEVDTEVKLFQKALDFSSIKLRECMIPRTQIVAIEINTATNEQLLEKFIETGLSKILVYDGSIDDIVGYIHSLELINCGENWRERIRPISIVPETLSAQKLMKDLMSKKRSIALVVDEFGGTAGIVTLEDIVEEIFGDIEDEHDTQTQIAKQVDDKAYELSGRIEITKINELFGIDMPESDEYLTIAGYILHHHQAIPKQGESIEIGSYTFKIVKSDGSKIEQVILKYN